MSRLYTLVTALVVLLLVGCGGSPDTPPATTDQPSPTSEVTSAGADSPTAQATTASGDAATPTAAITVEPTVEATIGATTVATAVSTAASATTPAATVAATAESVETQMPGATASVSDPVGQAASSFPLTYTDAGGRKVTLEKQPERIISLFATNNDTLFAIGAGDRIVAVDDFTTTPAEAAEKPKVGGNNFQFDVERMVALKPDLVITSAGTEELVDKPLRDAGITVIATPYPTSLEGVYTLMSDLGRITGNTDASAREVARLRATVDDVRTRLANARKVSVYYESDISTPGKPFTAGPGSLTHDLIRAAGGTNVFGTGNNPFPQVGFEAIVKANPQVILLGNVKGYVPELFFSPTTVQEVKQRKGFRTIAAVRNNRVVPVYIDRLVPGPKLNQGLRDVAVAIHPEVFGER